jgi:hypothetical protein
MKTTDKELSMVRDLPSNLFWMLVVMQISKNIPTLQHAKEISNGYRI